ncbi:MAG: acetylxylan esterase [Verrucomicrobiaceae bacterium]|nr:acetylxylan esterase [Verrucomicrobiaceae bacterium]
MIKIFRIGVFAVYCTSVAFGQARRSNEDESRVGQYTLPDVLKCADGTTVTTVADWTGKRRAEVMRLFEEHVYGKTPATPKLDAKVLSERKDALGGIATRRIVRLKMKEKPAWDGIDVMIYIPNGAKKPVPAFVGLSFGGNHAVSPDIDVPISDRWMRPTQDDTVRNSRATVRSRGKESHRWPLEMILKRGYAVVTAYYGDIEPDHTLGWKDGVRGALAEKGADTVWKDGEWGAIGAWAWGLSRMLDYAETVDAIDAKHCSVIGHSRLGKTSLWAGAQDERFAMVVSNDSGEGGAAIMRRDFGETTKIITTVFPHWFTPTYARYSDKAGDCPVDQHMLISLMAPRPVCIASAEEDLWADPKGEFLSGLNAQPVYDLFGLKGVGVKHQPAVNTPVGDVVRYHMRTGKHDVTDFDWQRYLDAADAHLKK